MVERVLYGHGGSVNSVCVSADRARVISGSWDNSVRVWDVASGRVERVLEGHSDSVSSVCVRSIYRM